MLSQVWLQYQRDSGSRRQVQSCSPPSTALQYEINPLHCMSCLFLGLGCRGFEITAGSKYSKKRSRRRKATSRAAGALKLMTWEKLGCAGASERREAPRQTQETDRKISEHNEKKKEMQGKSQKLPVPESVSSFHHFMFAQFSVSPLRRCSCDSAHLEWRNRTFSKLGRMFEL